MDLAEMKEHLEEISVGEGAAVGACPRDRGSAQDL
jgi:hypothetical protein